MLPPFHIRNLQPSSLPKASQDTLVQINAPYYDETISNHPAATLKYHDEDDGDLITLGSSRELSEKLEEPLSSPSSGLSADSQPDLPSSEHHVFEIEDRDHVRKLWQDIQKASGEDSEDLPVFQDRSDAMNWSAEKKDMLAIFYEKRRHEIWNPIAEQLGVTWQSVDAMHWALGRKEMARRASELDSYSKQSGNSEDIAETHPKLLYSNPDTQNLEDYRVHHFNASEPPQVQLPIPATPQLVKATAGQVSLPGFSDVNPNRSASSSTGKNGEANLTMEGKRQAQAAGDKLRTRTTLSRNRKGALTAVDSHQNRWANYKSSTSAFLPKASISVPQAFDGPGLTSEGKRQAQVAGDKLRCRTNPIRHSRPSRVGSLERGISKNRWSSYSGTRATRFDERQDAQEEARDASNSTDTDEVPKDGQPSLLEVFEAEMAKKTSPTDSEGAPRVGSTSVPEPATRADISTETSQSQPLPQGSRAIFGLITELTAGDMTLSQDFSSAIDHGIRTAVKGFDACLQGIARGLQEVSSASRQAADRARNADLKLKDDSTLGFQSLTGAFSAALGRDMAPNGPGTAHASRNRLEEVNSGSSSTTSGISYDRDPNEDEISTHKSNESPPNGGVDQSETAYNARLDFTAAPTYSRERPASPQLGMEFQPKSRPVISKVPRFHRPGPIHLQNRPGYVEHLRRSQSTKTLGDQNDRERAVSPPVDTHFPTLAQFEGKSFGAAPSFPALPSMEPLIPQQARRQSFSSTKAGEFGPADRSFSYVSTSNGAELTRRFFSTAAGPHKHSAPRNGHEVVSLSRPSSAARLAGPFNPLEAEPLAQPYLNEGLRRNVTIASTDIRHTPRRRRPYSEVFDGSGRVAWGAFLQDNGHGPRGHCRASDDRSRLLGAHQQHLNRFSRHETGSRSSPLAQTGYDDQHHDDSTVGKINSCVEQLRELGFGRNDDSSAARLLVYAQAADGVLVDAIDMIDEEQRAYREIL